MRLSRHARKGLSARTNRRAPLSVEYLEDRRVLAVFTVTNTDDTGTGSLREAITLSNDNAGTDTIEFNIPGAGPHVIQVGATTSQPLPMVTANVTIDGYTQPGAAANTNPVGQGLNTILQIELRGDNAGVNAHGLHIERGTTIRGLAIGNFSGDAIHVEQFNNVIEGNFLGTDAAGTTALPNNQAVVLADTSNTIGGTTPAARNLISGNATNAITITADSNSVLGNIIGLGPDGDTVLANGANGVFINGAAGNSIGGFEPGAGNLISGNVTNAVTIVFGPSPGNRIQGNYLGTDVTGTLDRGNGFFGVLTFDTVETEIGGSGDGDGNLISGNDDDGVFLQGNSNNAEIRGNRIGTNADGTAALGNGDNGIELDNSDNVLIAGNHISGNVDHGVHVNNGSDDAIVVANRIGTNATGDAAIANGEQGVRVEFSVRATIGGSTVGSGNHISGNTGSGVLVRQSSNAVIAGNLIGADATGTTAIPNATGVEIQNSTNNRVGGTTAGEGNLLSGNQSRGVFIFGTFNTVQGNLIGTDIDGLTALPNFVGVEIRGGDDNLIGGSTAAARNVISGNTSQGVYLITGGSSTPLRPERNRIQGNYVGLTINGDAAIAGHISPAIDVFGGLSNQVGGDQPGEGNVVSGNSNTGISIRDEANDGEENIVQGNLVGTDATGTSAIPNRLGIVLGSQHTLVGGLTPAAGNVVSGNTENGISSFAGFGHEIRNNLVGLQVDGTSPLGNGQNGIELDGNDSSVRDNVIAYNERNGVVVAGSSQDPTQSIVILSNRIFHNGRLGIDLGAFAIGNEGVTLNDADDSDTGQNGLQNYPVLTNVASNGTTTIEGSLTSTPDSDFIIEFFANTIRGFDFVNLGASDAVPGQFGEGEMLLGSIEVTTDANGFVAFTANNLPAIDETIPFVNATATDITDDGNGPRNNTSEFGPLLPLGGESTVVTRTGENGTGTLLEAIFVANVNEGFDTIGFNVRPDDPRHFYYTDDGIAGQVTPDNIAVTTEADDANLPTSGPQAVDPDWPHSWFSFQPSEALPLLTDWVLIDGFTQPGSSANTLHAPGPLDTVPKIELDAQNFIGNALEFDTGAEGSRVQGLTINRYRGDGIHLRTFGGVSMSGNFIGTDVSGTVALANTGNGIALHDDRFYHIGGRTPAERNLISGNFEAGVLSFSAAGGIIEGNVIGMDRTASEHLSNRGPAVLLTGDRGSPLTTIGGIETASANVIGENGGGAIDIISPRFPQPFPFGNPVVELEVCRNDFVSAFQLREQFFASGTPADFQALFIASASFFQCAQNETNDTLPGQANPILGNLIHTGASTAIDIGGDGITPNDGDDTNTPQIDPDADGGANNYQNYPVLDSVTTSGGVTTISGSLESHTDSDFRLEFFSTPTANPTGHGGGTTFLGFVEVQTDANGEAPFAFDAPEVLAGHFVTATATLLVDHDEDPQTRALEIETSEFAADLEVGVVPITDDFGDAPATYGTLIADDGARHTVVNGFSLGSSVTAEADGQPSTAADADTDNGVTFFGDIPQGVPLTQITVNVTNSAGVANPYLDVWVDWNQNGQWETLAERVASQAVVAGNNTIGFAVPNNVALGETFIRVRLHQATGEGLLPTGAATSGEVEDYRVTVVEEYFPWHNASNPNEIDMAGDVNLTDALTIVSFLRNNGGSAALPVPTTPTRRPPPFYDANRDNRATISDALQIVAFLRQQLGGEGEFGKAAVQSKAVETLPIPTDVDADSIDDGLLAYLAEYDGRASI